MFENLREDWVTYEGDIARQGLWAMAVYRFGRWRYSVRPAALRKVFSFVYRVLKVVSQILTGIDIPCETEIGRRFVIEHFGGIVISGDTIIGDDVTVRNGVTLGLRRKGQRGAPRIGNRVDIGAGAKVLGPITIGDDVAIGANAVVLQDVPAGHIAVGVPATIRPRRMNSAAQPQPASKSSGAVGMIASLLIVVCALGAHAAQAQSLYPPYHVPDNFPEVKKDRPLSTVESLKQFEELTAGSYEFGEGDEITVEVWGRAELSGHQTIGPDGNITLPLIGILHISGMSREGAVEAIKSAYASYYDDLSVNIRVEKYTSNRVFILGRVSHPGTLDFEGTPSLLEAITRAGSLPVGGEGANKAALNRCAIFRGHDAVVWVDLKALLTDGNLGYNLRLKRNDVIYIPDSDDQLVYVLGEVAHPGAIRLTPGMSFMDAYAQSGGVTHDGTESRIHLIRLHPELHRVFALSDLMNPHPELNAGLQDGDIIYVQKRALAKFGYVTDKLAPFANWMIAGKLLTK